MDLILKIEGGVQESNFNEFKELMLSKIEEANIPLVTDDDFAFAEKTVKAFKQAEDTISLAKHNATRSTEDIAKLFEGLDELSTNLRNVRLEMNKKVKDEKAKRKMQVIDAGCEQLGKSIDLSAKTVPEIHNAIRVDRALFEKAVSGKRSIEKMEEAVAELVESEQAQLTDMQVLILDNKALLEKCEYPSLFPDAATIVCKPSSEVESLIEGRVAKHKLAERERKEKEEAEGKAKQEREEAKALKEKEVPPGPAQEDKQPEPEPAPTEPQPKLEKKEWPTGGFVLTMNLHCSTEEAKRIAGKVNDLFGGYGEVVKIGLSRA